MKRLVVIDGYSFLFRAYHSMPALTRPKDNVPVGAVYGFMSMIMKILSDMTPTHIVIVFDSGQKTIRHEIYSEYKANRPPPPDDLIPQFSLVREAAKALNVAVLERQGYEADDIIATIANIATTNKEDVLIVSSDKDLMQLVNTHVKMYDAIKNKIIGEPEVEEKYGVAPSKIRDLLALVGDTSDNVPGVPGIGPKTAAELLNRFENLDNIFANLDQIKQPKRRESLQKSTELVKLSKSLVSLFNNLDLGVPLSSLESKKIEGSELMRFLNEQGFKTLVLRAKKMFGIEEKNSQNPNAIAELSPNKITEITDVSILKKVATSCNICAKISIYLQSNFIKSDKVKNIDDLGHISICLDGDKNYVIKIAAEHNQASLLDSQHSNGVSWKDFLLAFKPLLEDDSIAKITWDYKRFLHLLDESGFTINPLSFEDIMMSAYDLGSGQHNTDFFPLIEYFLDIENPISETTLAKTRSNFNNLDETRKLYYIAKYSYLTHQAYIRISELLHETKSHFFYKRIDLPITRIVFDVEKNGFKLNKQILLDLDQELEKEINLISEEIYALSGSKFNISSSQQLADVLFNQLGFESKQKSNKSGNLSTSVEVLEQLQQEGHKIADLLMQWRKLNKIKSTYTTSLASQAKPGVFGERVHTNFSIAYTATGRFSSTEPNLQNIPVKGRWADRIRSAFIAREGYKILTLDYSQIELRIAAEIANVKSLQEAFKNNLDIHKVTASEMFNVALDDVTKELRSKAKAINFGIIYGISGYGLAKNVGISQSEAKEYINRYFAKYPEIASYMEESKEFARKHGYILTLYGRRCYVQNITSKDYNKRSFAERAAINFPIQGSSSDIMRNSMVNCHNAISSSNLDCKMILQIHDELLFEVKESDVEKATKLIKNTMESSCNLSIPLPVNYKIGDTWAST